MNSEATSSDDAAPKPPSDTPVIDVATHVSEPLDLWTSRATQKYRDRVPQMKMLDRQWVWTIDLA